MNNDYFWEVPEEWSLQDADMYLLLLQLLIMHLLCVEEFLKEIRFFENIFGGKRIFSFKFKRGFLAQTFLKNLINGEKIRFFSFIKNDFLEIKINRIGMIGINSRGVIGLLYIFGLFRK